MSKRTYPQYPQPNPSHHGPPSSGVGVGGPGAHPLQRGGGVTNPPSQEGYPPPQVMYSTGNHVGGVADGMGRMQLGSQGMPPRGQFHGQGVPSVTPIPSSNSQSGGYGNPPPPPPPSSVPGAPPRVEEIYQPSPPSGPPGSQTRQPPSSGPPGSQTHMLGQPPPSVASRHSPVAEHHSRGGTPPTVGNNRAPSFSPTSRMMSGPPTSGMAPTSGMTSGPPMSGIVRGPPTSGMASGPPTSGMTGGPPTSGKTGGPPTSGMTGGPPLSGIRYPPGSSGMLPSVPLTGPISSGAPTVLGGTESSAMRSSSLSGPAPNIGYNRTQAPIGGGLTGPPTTGGLTGPPTTGGLTGPSNRFLSGPPTGNMPGPPTRSISGPPTGNMTGPPTGSISGPPTGIMAGPPTGSISGGNMPGPPTGNMPGPPTGNMPGPPTGNMPGPPTGNMPGPPTGNMPGPPTGNMPGPPTGNMPGPPTGNMPGPPTGNMPGPSTGNMPGPPTGNMSGPPRGRASHQLSGIAAGPETLLPGQSLPGQPLPGQHQPLPGQPLPGQPLPGQPLPGQPLPGQATAPPGMVPAQKLPDGVVTSDPHLQPVNLMEHRHILPPEPIEPPPIILPNNFGRFAPDHRVFACTMNAIPATNSLLNKIKLPLAIHIHPYKDMTPRDCPVLHPSIIVRCRSCRAYINPYVTFVDSRHWRCNLCFRSNTIPDDFDYNANTGHHGDKSHRMEIKRSAVEYIAPSEYMVRPPQPCVYFFVVDVSFTSIESGVLSVFCRCLLDQLERLPGDARTLIGILTFDSSLHFYSFPTALSQPQMMVVSDLDDVFLPYPESLLVNLREFREMFRGLLEDLPRIFAKNQSDKSALGAALHAATKLLHPIGGRITVIQCSLPNIGPGALKYRDVAPPSTKMPTLNMAPATDFYKSLALECNSQQISIDLFAFSGQFMDLSTIGCASKISSGQVFHYYDFHHSRKPSRERFVKDFQRYLTRKIGFEAVMRIRCSEGLSLHTFHGNFFVRSTDLLSLPSVNPDLGYTINLSIDENLKDLGSVCFQAALLYTSSRGERRIRVHTLCLPVTTQLTHIYARLNVLAITGTLANMAVDRATGSSLGDAREALMNTLIDSGKMYRNNVASSLQASQYTLPASIKLLPLLIIALLKSAAFTLSMKVSYDRRTQAMNLIKALPLDYLMCLVYPRLYAVHLLSEKDLIDRDDGGEELAPPILHLSAEKLDRYGVFLMDYGLGLYLWVCKDASQEYISHVLGVRHFGAIPEIMCELPSLKNECSVLLTKLVKQIRSTRQHYLPLQVIREDGPHRLQFIEKLVDDRTEFGTSYYELLSHIARQQSK